MMLPFEGMGVAAFWEFRMPKAANQFDFNTIADVLITIEYTALDSPTYRQQVIRGLDRTISADRPFSFRNQFADAWYDLHNPDLMSGSRTPMAVSFNTIREDFPPNITELKTEAISLYISRKPEMKEELKVKLKFTGNENSSVIESSATTVNGIVSKRQGNAGGLNAMIDVIKLPIGEWTLVLDNKPEVRKLFENDLIEDILFVITYGGATDPWPG
jgi:hypothetical protein